MVATTRACYGLLEKLMPGGAVISTVGTGSSEPTLRPGPDIVSTLPTRRLDQLLATGLAVGRTIVI
jgi:hypothetical protein